MARIKRSVRINAPVNVVFDQLQYLDRWPVWWAEVVEIRGQGQDTRAGDREQTKLKKGMQHTWTHKVLGIPLSGSGTITELVPNERASMKTEGDIESSWDVRFSAERNQTKVEVTLDYNVVGGRLGQIADRVLLERMNAKELEQGLQRLRIISERVA